MEARFTVIATPAPQGSKKFVGMSKAGHAMLVESSSQVRPWREAVVWAARESRARLCGPVSVSIYFTLAKPKSAPKNRRTWPDRKPDLSKLVRSTEDALVDAGVIEDDARIVRLVTEKVFPGEHEFALDVPGALIEIRCLSGAVTGKKPSLFDGVEGGRLSVETEPATGCDHEGMGQRG